MGKTTQALTLRESLVKAEDITGYDSSSKKKAFQRDAKAFLKSLAVALGFSPSSYSIRVNEAGPAVSGEVTLHAHYLYVQLSEDWMASGVSVLYRSCKSQRDYSGGQNHILSIRALTEAGQQERFIDACRHLCVQGRSAA